MSFVVRIASAVGIVAAATFLLEGHAVESIAAALIAMALQRAEQDAP